MDELDGIQQLPQDNDRRSVPIVINMGQKRIADNVPQLTVCLPRAASMENVSEVDEFLKGLAEGGGFGCPAFSC